MSESQPVLDFHRHQHLVRSKVQLAGVQANRESFEGLADLYENALDSLMWCWSTGQWQWVLDFMDCLYRFLHWQGHWTDAAKYIRYVLDAAVHLQDARAQAQWMLYTGIIQTEQGRHEQAELYYRQSLSLAQDGGETGIQAEVWRRLGWLAHAQAQRQKARTRYQRAIELHRQAHDLLGEATDRRQLGILAMEAEDLGQAERDLRSSLALAEGHVGWQAQQLQAGAWLDLGRISLRQGHLEEASRRFYRALTHIEQAPDRLLQGDIYFYLAELAEEKGDWEEAQKRYQDRLLLAEKAGDRPGQTSASIALGNLWLLRARDASSEREHGYEQAQRCYEQALKFADRHNQAVARAQLGTLAYYQGHYQQAQACLLEALRSFQELGHQTESADCHHQLGLIAQTQEQWLIAQEHYQTSLDIRRGLGLFHRAVQSLYQLGTLAQQRGQYKEARLYYQLALREDERGDGTNRDQICRALAGLP